MEVLHPKRDDKIGGGVLDVTGKVLSSQTDKSFEWEEGERRNHDKLRQALLSGRCKIEVKDHEKKNHPTKTFNIFVLT